MTHGRMRRETEWYKLLRATEQETYVKRKNALKLDLVSEKDKNKARQAVQKELVCEREREKITEHVSEKMHLCLSVHVYIWKTEASRWGITCKSRRDKTETGWRDVCRQKRKEGMFIVYYRDDGKRQERKRRTWPVRQLHSKSSLNCFLFVCPLLPVVFLILKTCFIS